ncbi:MAG: FAD binding domain-containing protein, partial [Gemmatimonadota bacterium]
MLRLPPFTYHEPTTLARALKLKAEAGATGMYVAGGTDLLPNMKRRHQEPQTIISLGQIKKLYRIRSEERGAGSGTGNGEKGRGKSGVVVGAMVTLTELAEHRRIRRDYPVLAKAAELVSTPPLRNMGTFGGNLCLDTRCNYYNQSYEWRKAIDFCMKKDGEICWVAPSSPRCWAVNSSDTAPVVVALDAQLTLVAPEGERVVPAREFYNNDGIDYLNKRPDEILTAIHLPQTDGWDATYWKLRRRGSFDFPVLGVAAWIKWDGAVVADARIVLGAVASYPVEMTDAANQIIGSKLDDDAITAAAEAAFKPTKPMDNTDHGLAWRKEMTRNYVSGALMELRDRR